MTPGQMQQSAGEAFESARRMGASEGEAMDMALRELARCRQLRRTPSARGHAIPLSDAVRAVVEVVLAAHRFTVADARKRGRFGYCARISKARDEAVYVARIVDPDVSYPALGALLDRDHSSLISGQRKFEARLKADELLATRIRKVVEAARRPEQQRSVA